MRNLLIPLCIAITPISAAAYVPSQYFYVAGNVGIFKAEMNQSYLDQTDVITQNIQQPVIQHGYTGGLALGYRQAWCGPYFVGGEVLANIDTQNATFQSGASTAAFSDTTNVGYHADLTFVPGIYLTDTVSSYLKVGVSVASITDNLTSPVGDLATPTSYNNHKYRPGFVAGLGISKCLTNNFSVFTEASYHDYGSVSLPQFQNFSATYTHSAHIYTYGVVIGLSYKC